MVHILILVVFLPFLSFLLCSLLGRFVGSRGSMLISTLLMSLTVLLAGFLYYNINLSGDIYSLKLLS